MTAGAHHGFAALVHSRGAAGAATAAATAASLAAAAASAAWIAPHAHRNPFVAKAAAAAVGSTRGMCPLGYGVGQDPKHLYKVGLMEGFALCDVVG
jgi:hypothetical protein